MAAPLVQLDTTANGYIWARPEAIRLIRTTENSKPNTHFIQLHDGLEYEMFGGPSNTLAALGVKYGE
jgi:hypothetical protein